MSLGLLFPGQGTQHAGMLRWLGSSVGALEPLALLDETLGTDWRARLNDRVWATRNDVAQCLLTGVCLAAWEKLRPLLPAPVVVAGYSVGELAAFSVAGVFSPTVAMRLAQRRAQVMDHCVRGRATGLLSVGTALPDMIERLCCRHTLAVAIRIGPSRCILGGMTESLDAAENEAVRAGASCARLAVSIASHTPWLSEGVAPLAEALEAVPFERPFATLVCNYGGVALNRIGDLRHALAAQIAQTVPWDRCMETIVERRVRCVLEVGPGTTLARLWSAGYPMIPARSLDEFQSPEAAALWVREALIRG